MPDGAMTANREMQIIEAIKAKFNAASPEEKRAMLAKLTPEVVAMARRIFGEKVGAFAAHHHARKMARGGQAGASAPMSMSGYTGPVKGPGGGQDDTIDAKLSDGEHVFDADTVSALGDGSNDEGHRRLETFKRNLRAQKRSAKPNAIPPKTKSLSTYFRSAR